MHATVDVGINAFPDTVEVALAADAIFGDSEVVCDMSVSPWMAAVGSRGVDVLLRAIQ